MAESSLYRRPLPPTLIPFSSARGRILFREALDAGTLESFFPLIEQFHTQSDPAYCGLGSLVMALNSLGIDPGRAWRGSWRWFSEELLDCCTPLDHVQKRGLSIEEVACLARCNGADVTVSRPSEHGIDALRADLNDATRGTEQVVISSYSRSKLGQTGAGHFSPVGGYHPGEDLALILDVARFKYPPHWVELGTLFSAMHDLDPTTERARGWLVLKKRSASSAIAHFLFCPEGIGVKEIVRRLLDEHAAALRAWPPVNLSGLLERSAAVLEQSGILSHVQFRSPTTPEQSLRLAQLNLELQGTEFYRRAVPVVPSTLLTPLLLWFIAAPENLWSMLQPGLANELQPLLDATRLPASLRTEVALLRSQVEFLLEHAHDARSASAATASARAPEGVSGRLQIP
jgi:glutathione gamma-glutamylcysteinyltransferase